MAASFCGHSCGVLLGLLVLLVLLVGTSSSSSVRLLELLAAPLVDALLRWISVY